MTEALAAVSKERDGLANELDQARKAQQAAAQLAEATHDPCAARYVCSVTRTAGLCEQHFGRSGEG